VPFDIAHVSPHAWEAGGELNLHVERVAHELSQRGHRVMIVAPSQSSRLAASSRRALRDAREQPQRLWDGDGAPTLFAAGEVVSVGTATRPGRGVAVPVDVARTVDELLSTLPLDFVHVHEPFAPSTSSTALRHSRSLNVGTFHTPADRLISTQVTRRFVELFFGRLDARIASYRATAAMMSSHFPADYRVIAPGADVIERLPSSGALQIAFVEEEERAALRVFLRALRRLGTSADWQATVLTARGSSSRVPLRAEIAERVRFAEPDELDRDALLAAADVVVLGSAGVAPAPGLALAAIGAGAVPVASRLAVYEETLGEGERGLLYDPGDAELLAALLARLTGEPALLARLRRGSDQLRAKSLSWARVADELEEVYGLVAARRRTGGGNAAIRRTISSRPLIDVDLHMHTDHSPDCATPVEVLLATARAEGLGAIAVTDHNEISGALDAARKASGIKVIVGEEVKTANQGEVIGLFLTEKIPRGLSLEQTVAEIRRQGGLVYVPHPFDRLHAVPDYEHMLAILDEIDAIEIFNPRVAISSFNEEAVRFAAKYRLVAGAGSDAHVAAGLGSVRVRMRDFDGPEEFLESLREAEIQTRPTSLLYVQALKFIETKATPPPARRARRDRRVRRAMRKS
jgi:glycosyltransferase involved in cell wall biosynthesis